MPRSKKIGLFSKLWSRLSRKKKMAKKKKMVRFNDNMLISPKGLEYLVSRDAARKKNYSIPVRTGKIQFPRMLSSEEKVFLQEDELPKLEFSYPEPEEDYLDQDSDDSENAGEGRRYKSKKHKRKSKRHKRKSQRRK